MRLMFHDGEVKPSDKSKEVQDSLNISMNKILDLIYKIIKTESHNPNHLFSQLDIPSILKNIIINIIMNLFINFTNPPTIEDQLEMVDTLMADIYDGFKKGIQALNLVTANTETVN